MTCYVHCAMHTPLFKRTRLEKFFYCEAFPKNDLRENRCDKVGNGVFVVPIWRKKTEEGKSCAAEPLEEHQKSNGTGGSCLVLLFPQIPLLTHSCVMSLCTGTGSFFTGLLCRKNAEGSPDVEMQRCSSFSNSSALNVCCISVCIFWRQICCDCVLVSL